MTILHSVKGPATRRLRRITDSHAAALLRKRQIELDEEGASRCPSPAAPTVGRMGLQCGSATPRYRSRGANRHQWRSSPGSRASRSPLPVTRHSQKFATVRAGLFSAPAGVHMRRATPADSRRRQLTRSSIHRRATGGAIDLSATLFAGSPTCVHSVTAVSPRPAR